MGMLLAAGKKNLATQHMRGRLSEQFTISLNKKSAGEGSYRDGYRAGFVSSKTVSRDCLLPYFSITTPGYWSSGFRGSRSLAMAAQLHSILLRSHLWRKMRGRL